MKEYHFVVIHSPDPDERRIGKSYCHGFVMGAGGTIRRMENGNNLVSFTEPAIGEKLKSRGAVWGFQVIEQELSPSK